MLPRPVVVVIALGLLALLAWNVIVAGPEGYPIDMILGGLLGGILGLDRVLTKRGDDQGGSPR